MIVHATLRKGCDITDLSKAYSLIVFSPYANALQVKHSVTVARSEMVANN